MTLPAQARRLAKLLMRLDVRVVFAESCTAGLVSASLSKIPGISEHHCGSAVTYRNDTKHRWLKVADDVLDRPGPVSSVVACAMAEGVLRATREADWAASVTGHLGPDAPKRLDGVIYIAIVARRALSRRRSPRHAVARKYRLTSTTRNARQREAVQLVFTELCDAIEASVENE